MLIVQRNVQNFPFFSFTFPAATGEVKWKEMYVQILRQVLTVYFISFIRQLYVVLSKGPNIDDVCK